MYKIIGKVIINWISEIFFWLFVVWLLMIYKNVFYGFLFNVGLKIYDEYKWVLVFVMFFWFIIVFL